MAGYSQEQGDLHMSGIYTGFSLFFNYIPMAGLLMAFQDFSPVKGIFGSEWVGLKNLLIFSRGLLLAGFEKYYCHRRFGFGCEFPSPDYFCINPQ